MREIWALAVKDLKLLVRDKAGLFFTFFFPVLYAIFFGTIFGGMGGGGGGSGETAIVVVDQDGTDKAFFGIGGINPNCHIVGGIVVGVGRMHGAGFGIRNNEGCDFGLFGARFGVFQRVFAGFELFFGQGGRFRRVGLAGSPCEASQGKG